MAQPMQGKSSQATKWRAQHDSEAAFARSGPGRCPHGDANWLQATKRALERRHRRPHRAGAYTTQVRPGHHQLIVAV